MPVIRLALGAPVPAVGSATGRLVLIEDPDASHTDWSARSPSLTTAASVEVRGTVTATFPKRSFNLELLDDVGRGRALSLPGMPAGEDWVLYACYWDKTCLRNALAYTLGQGLGRWNPRFRFVELYVDGEYQGLYNLVERIRRGRERVDVPRPAPDETGDLSGGYIFRHEGAGKGTSTDWVSMRGTIWTHHYPSAEVISPAQRTYLRALVDRFEALMDGEAWADPQRGYRPVLDVPSWVDYALVQELANNWDGYVRSVYFYKTADAQGGLIHAGPLWDFDVAFGNINQTTSSRTDTWSYVKPQRKGLDGVPVFFSKLWTDPAFQREARCRWQALRRGPLERQALNDLVNGWVASIRPAVDRDQARWHTIRDRIGLAPHQGDSYEYEVAWLRHWLDRRITWLDENLPGTCE